MDTILPSHIMLSPSMDQKQTPCPFLLVSLTSPFVLILQSPQVGSLEQQVDNCNNTLGMVPASSLLLPSLCSKVQLEEGFSPVHICASPQPQTHSASHCPRIRPTSLAQLTLPCMMHSLPAFPASSLAPSILGWKLLHVPCSLPTPLPPA